MRSARINLELGTLDDLRGFLGRGLDRDDLIVVTVDDECRPVDLLQVFGIVDLRELPHAIVLALDAAHHALEPEGLTQAFVDLRAVAVEAVERNREILEELRAVARRVLADAVEDLHGRTLGISLGLQHQRSEEHTSELQSRQYLVCRLLLEKKKT